MFRYLRLTALALATALLPAALRAAEASGPAKGTSPMLTIDPVNVEGDAYCLTCQAGRNPAVVAFLTKNDGASQELLSTLAAQAKAHAARRLRVTAVVVGGGEAADALVAYARERELALPVAVVAADGDALKPWALNPKVANTVVFLDQHKVDHATADLAADKLAEHVQALVGDSQTGHSGHAGH